MHYTKESLTVGLNDLSRAIEQASKRDIAVAGDNNVDDYDMGLLCTTCVSLFPLLSLTLYSQYAPCHTKNYLFGSCVPQK